MTDDERIGREWCARHGKCPYRPGCFSHWLGGGRSEDYCVLPKVLLTAVGGESRQYTSDAAAYAAVGAALREMRAVAGA